MKFLKILNQAYINQSFNPNFLSLFINPFYLTGVLLIKILKEFRLEMNGELLDFGCGSKPYKNLFTNVSSYIGVDIEYESYGHEKEDIDYFYDGKNLPFDDNRFNLVFSTEILDHVPDIQYCLKEINRVLKPKGKLLISIPFAFPEHELPYEFRRLTRFGIVQVFEDNGFKLIKYRCFGSFIRVIFQLKIMYVHDLLYTKNKYINLLINSIFISLITLIGLIFSFLLPNNRSMYFETVVFAEKN